MLATLVPLSYFGERSHKQANVGLSSVRCQVVELNNTSVRTM